MPPLPSAARLRAKGGGELRLEITDEAIRRLAVQVQTRYAAPKRREVAAVLAKFGELMLAEAQTQVPVDTGNLKSSIRLFLEELAFTISTDVTYAAYVELGTARAAAQPFMLPAFLRYREQIYREVRAVLSSPAA